MNIRLGSDGYNYLIGVIDGWNSDPDIRLGALRDCILALMAEVEALREALILDAISRGTAAKRTPYGRAYVQTGLLTHNNAGPIPGHVKLIKRFVEREPGYHGPNLLSPMDPMRENLMLERLGFTEDEIAEYRQQAEEYSMFT